MVEIPGHKGNANQNTLRFPITPMRMVAIKNMNNKCWQGCGDKGTLIHCWWECKLVQPLWKTIWRLLKKLQIELLYDAGILLLGYTGRNVTQVTAKEPAHPYLLHYS
jgi:hypothetical protein